MEKQVTFTLQFGDKNLVVTLSPNAKISELAVIAADKFGLLRGTFIFVNGRKILKEVQKVREISENDIVVVNILSRED
jgi:hypothetical protein